MSVRFVQQYGPSTYLGSLILTVRGSDVLYTLNGVGFTVGDDIAFRAWYRISTGESGIRFTVNGVTIETLGTTTGSALAAPTVAKFGSDVSGANNFTALWTKIVTHNVADPAAIGSIAPFEFFGIGDSIATSYPNLTNIFGFLYTRDITRRSKPGVISQALSGSTITGEQGAFDASVYKGSPHIRAIIIQVGINDILQGASTATFVSRYQALVNDVAAAFPGIPIVGVKLSPCRTYLDLNDPGQYAQWLLVNIAIGGGGGTPITGLAAVTSSHVTTMNDGSDHLAAAYCLPGSFNDGLHPGQLGRKTIGLAIRASLVGIGITP
jgi:lysophospholipase L1-like esterase